VRRWLLAFVVLAALVTGCANTSSTKATYTCYYSDGSTSTTTRTGSGAIGPGCR
jgi:uncharacterized lipoprotein YmbA